MKLDEGYYQSPRWSYELLDCAMPMSLDSYSNCAHQCVYCFSFFQRAIGLVADDYLHHRVRAINPDKVKRMFLDPVTYGGQFAAYIKRRMVLQWGGLSDGFDWYEKKFGVSYDLLKFFNDIDYPVSISTKGVWHVYDKKYRELYKNAKNQHWKFSIISSNEEHVKKIEPGVPSAHDRFRAMYELNKLGVAATTLRYRPFIIGISDLCIDEMMQMAADAGCLSVTTELLGWESRASNTSKERLKVISEVVGYDVWDFYIKNSSKTSGLLRLNYDIKREYILRMKEAADKQGLKFFVSDAHMKEYSYHAGCCGLPESGPLSNANKGQFAEAILIAKKNGFVRWADIKKQAKEIFSDTPFFKAEGFPNSSEERAKHRYHSMYDYMHDMWNTPGSYMSPNRYFGGALVAGGTDDDGDIVYLYNKPFVEEGVRIGSVNELALQLRMVGKPNEERYNELTADGSQFGHVAYPVFVISRGRWAKASTIELLQNSRINFTLVVQEDEYEKYEAKYPEIDIISMTKTNADEVNGAGRARAFVYDYCEEQGYASYVWILDDDIESVADVESNEQTTLRSVMSFGEGFIEDYSNVAMFGFNNNEENTHKKFLVNQPVRGLMLVNLQTGLGSFNSLYNVYEDIEFAVRHLANNWTTIVHNRFRVKYMQLSGGGAIPLYLSNNEAHALCLSYPLYMSLEEENGVPYPEIEWNSFDSVLKNRNVELLMKGE